MSWDKIQERWSQWRGEAREQWARITDSEWDRIAGCREKLVRTLQDCYGWARDEAEAQVHNYFQPRLRIA